MMSRRLSLGVLLASAATLVACDPVSPAVRPAESRDVPARIVISGASGQLGEQVVRDLLVRKVAATDLILVTRTPEKLAEFAKLGAQVRYGDAEKPESLPAAYAGGTKMLLISLGFVGPKRVDLHKVAIDAASKAGVKHIVYTSFSGADKGDNFLSADHHATEQYLMQSGITWTMLRNAIYTDALVDIAKKFVADGRAAAPADEPRFAPVARRDCAAAAAAVLSSPGQENRAYTITGPELIGSADIARAAADVTGRKVEIAADAAAASAIAPFAMLAPPTVSGDVESLTGHRPMTLRAVLASHQKELLPNP